MAISSVQYVYDPLDRLVSSVLASEPLLQRFYQHQRLATELQGDVTRCVFQSADQLLAQGDNTSTHLLITDLQRSVLGTDQEARQGYSPYGQRKTYSGLNTLLGFNGERPDPTSGHYLLGNGYRAYNPVLMRFNSPDSLSPFEGGGINAYAYCSGDPLNREDSTGHVWLSTFKRMVELNGAARATAIVRPLHHSSVGASGLRVTPARNELQAQRVMRPLPERVEGATTLNDVPVALVRPVQRQESQRVASQRSLNSTPTLNSGHSTPSSSSRDSTPPGSPTPRTRRRTDVVVNVTNMETGARSVRFIRDPDAAP